MVVVAVVFLSNGIGVMTVNLISHASTAQVVEVLSM